MNAPASVGQGELLSICIPTYNRSAMLKGMLETLVTQIREAGTNDVVIYVSDNASPDATPQVVQELQRNSQVPINYSRNATNVGVSKNLLAVMAMGRGRFIWTLGDDEVIAPNAISKLVRVLRERDPGFVLMYDTRYKLPVPPAGLYTDYREMARKCLELDNIHALAEHVLLSCNIYRPELYEPQFAEANIDTFFPHMFGMLRPLLRERKTVLIPDFPVISTREENRGTPSDGVWADLDRCWSTYLKWLRDEMQMPEMNPYAAGNAARRAMLDNIRSHPVAYLRRNWRALFQPSAYRFLFTRFFGARK